MNLNLNQKTVLSEFYSNFAIVWLAAGFVSPFFSPVEDKIVFGVRLITSIIIARILLQIGLDKLK